MAKDMSMDTCDGDKYSMSQVKKERGPTNQQADEFPYERRMREQMESRYGKPAAPLPDTKRTG